MELAPILLFVYNRLSHVGRTLEALAINDLASESDLFIYADNSKSIEDQEKVDEVRSYVRTVRGFRSVTIVERDENYGLARSIIAGVTEVVDRFGKVIVLEDDLITAPHFLRYMNDALDFHRDEERVASVSGYSFPLGRALPETFLLKYTACWGWGTWRRGWELFDPSGEKLLAEIRKRGAGREFDMDGAYPYLQMLEKQCRGEVDSWAVRWHASLFLADRLMLFPGRSLVSNIGHDGSGVHCSDAVHFDVALSDSPVQVGKIHVVADGGIAALLENYFRNLNPGLFRYLVRKIIKRLKI